MSLSKDKVLDKLRRVKGPDLDGNIHDREVVTLLDQELARHALSGCTNRTVRRLGSKTRAATR